jgi:toxin ParE1/3/4
MPRYVLSPQARDDLSDLRDYIAQDDPAAARRVLNEVREAMRRLAQMPELGHVREDLADEALRFWPVRSYLIIYRPETKPVQIVRVLSGYRDISQLLS